MGTQEVKIMILICDLRMKNMADGHNGNGKQWWKLPVFQSQIANRKRSFRLAGDIKIAHTIFALPFALLSTFLAANGMPPVGKLLLILICMVTARTVAMAVNRLLDARLMRELANRPPGDPERRLSANFFAVMVVSVPPTTATWLFQVVYHTAGY